MPSPIRLAFVAALAAFALGACSGGGGKPITTAGTMTPAPGATPAPSPTPTPAPTPGAPTAGDRTEFFPVREGQITWGFGSLSVPEGSTLQNLISNEGTDIVTFPQFSEFQFGALANANGIPLQKATKEDDNYAVIAYQAVLEHSMFLFQGGVYNTDSGSPDFNAVNLSTGVPTPSTSNPVAGTWKGKAVGLETKEQSGNSPSVSIAQAESRIVQANVEIGVSLDGDNQNVTWAFKDWTGGSTEHPDVSHEGTTLITEGDFASNDHYRAYFKDDDSLPVWTSRSVGIQFYGPGRQEAGGNFAFLRPVEAVSTWLRGVFAAKKQP